MTCVVDCVGSPRLLWAGPHWRGPAVPPAGCAPAAGSAGRALCRLLELLLKSSAWSPPIWMLTSFCGRPASAAVFGVVSVRAFRPRSCSGTCGSSTCPLESRQVLRHAGANTFCAFLAPCLVSCSSRLAGPAKSGSTVKLLLLFAQHPFQVPCFCSRTAASFSSKLLVKLNFALAPALPALASDTTSQCGAGTFGG